MENKPTPFDFKALVTAIQRTNEYMAAQAGRAVNIRLTLRNWVIGHYIREYEQNGADRAMYGKNLLSSLSQRLEEAGVKGCAPRSLRLYRQLYLSYPEIWQTVSATSRHALIPDPIWQTLSTSSETPGNLLDSESDTTDSVATHGKLRVPPERLLNSLSFSHFAELVAIDDPLKRAFYEIECIRGNWSVRELKRQIGSLYFERSGLSTNKEKLAQLVHSSTEQSSPRLNIRDPYVFEFLGIKPQEIMSEPDLEDALLDKLQEFLLELGNGFCFEARQKASSSATATALWTLSSTIASLNAMSWWN